MLKPTVIAVSLILSLNAFAVESDISQLAVSHFGHKNFHKCLKKGWRAASPTAAQTAQAKADLQPAKDLLATQKDAIKRDEQAIITAWYGTPISNQAV